MNEQDRYVLALLDAKEKELMAERRFVPILLADEHDLNEAQWPVVGLVALAVEGALAYSFLRFTMMWPASFAAGFSIALVALSSLGLKQVLDFGYGKAQNASTALRRLVFDDDQKGKTK